MGECFYIQDGFIGEQNPFVNVISVGWIHRS